MCGHSVVLEVFVNSRKHCCGDREGVARAVDDDDHAYELVEEFLELINRVRTVDLGGACDLLISRSIVER